MLKTVINWCYDLPIIPVIFGLCVVLLPYAGGLDLWITGLFYDADSGGFFWQTARPFERVYWFLAAIDAPILLGLIATLVWSIYRKWPSVKRRLLGFMLVTLVLGPGLITNSWLKDNSIGRARPVDVVQFGGDRPFTPVLVYSGACKRNCSFPSGHAAFGFYFLVLAWMFRSRKALVVGAAIGIFASLARIIQGGHFFTDTVFAFWVVFFTLVFFSYLFRLPIPFNPWFSLYDLRIPLHKPKDTPMNDDEGDETRRP